MRLFDFFKKKAKPENSEKNILLAMPIFNNGNSYQINKVIEHLKSAWALDITDFDRKNEVTAFDVNGETVVISNMPVPIPQGDIEGTAKYAYNWPSALKDLEGHTGHAIVTIISSKQSPAIDGFKLLSKVLEAILITSDAIGVYQGTQSLLIPRQQYLSYIEELKLDGIPVMLWVYIGLKKSETGNCAYTYGLKEFEKNEIEIIDSKLSLEELFDFLVNITAYVIGHNVTLKSGETIGVTAEQKIPIKLSIGQFVEGQSLKLEM